MQINVRYCGSPEIKMIAEGEWIDLYTCEDIMLAQGESALISLGIAMQLPDGWEANIVPRSSTFNKFGVIQTNHYGVIDTSYCGDNDIWKFGAYATRDTFIPKGSRICQFRLNRTMRAVAGDVQFNAVESLNNKDRGGFGTTGV